MNSLDQSATSLPCTADYARTHNRLPQRGLPKNKTGAFVEGHDSRHSLHTVPPLARPRGAPGPGYPPNYASQRTQKQVVQRIRARQDWRGGFFPQPVKRNKNKHLYERMEHRPSPHLLNGLPAYRDLTKRSARNYVTAQNNGVTHLEDLRSSASQSASSLRGDWASVTSEDFDLTSLTRLEDVCKRIEKEEVWTSTSRQGVRKLKSGKKQSPLVIRSFRNPQNPHPVVQYTDVREAHNSDRDQYSVARPTVPAPYFYSSRTLPRATDTGGSRVHLSRVSGVRSSEHILAAPGVGFLTRATLGLTGEGSLSGGVKGQPPPALVTRAKQAESYEQERFRVPSTTPATSIPDLPKGLQDDQGEGEKECVSVPDCNGRSADGGRDAIVKLTEQLDLGRSEPSIPVKITLSLETADGVSRAIDLEEEEERNKRDVEEYRAVEQTLLGITQSSSDPAVESKDTAVSDGAPLGLDDLLSEHSEIVHQINELEQRTSEDDGRVTD